MSEPAERDIEVREVAGRKVTVVEVMFPGETPLYDLYVDKGCLTNDGSLDHYPTDEDFTSFVASWLAANPSECQHVIVSYAGLTGCDFICEQCGECIR